MFEVLKLIDGEKVLLVELVAFTDNDYRSLIYGLGYPTMQALIELN